jgi:hypothetical protein
LCTIGSRIGTTISTIGTHSSGHPRKDDAEDQQQHRRGRQVERKQRLGDQRRAPQPRKDGTEVVRRGDEQQDHARRQQRRIDGRAKRRPAEAAVGERQQQHRERTDGAGVGRRRDAGEDHAERREDDDDDRGDADDELAHDGPYRFGTLVVRQRGSERRVQVAAHERVDDVEQRQQQAGKDGGREQIGRGHADDRTHDDQHHRRRDQDAERAAGGDRAGGERTS